MKCEICGKDEFELDIEFEVDKNNRVDMNQVIELISAYNKLFRTYKQLKTQINYLRKSVERKEETIINLQNERVPYTNEYVAKLENQQKEFIEYMNKTIEECNNYSKYIDKKTKELHGRSYGKTYIANEIMKNEVAKKILKETLSKYKEIIGVSDEKKIRYIEEIYTDKFRTLFQAILIDTWLVEKSNGRHSKEVRASVNPNLTTLLERRYLDKNCKIIKEKE